MEPPAQPSNQHPRFMELNEAPHWINAHDVPQVDARRPFHERTAACERKNRGARAPRGAHHASAGPASKDWVDEKHWRDSVSSDPRFLSTSTALFSVDGTSAPSVPQPEPGKSAGQQALDSVRRLLPTPLGGAESKAEHDTRTQEEHEDVSPGGSRPGTPRRDSSPEDPLRYVPTRKAPSPPKDGSSAQHVTYALSPMGSDNQVHSSQSPINPFTDVPRSRSLHELPPHVMAPSDTTSTTSSSDDSLLEDVQPRKTSFHKTPGAKPLEQAVNRLEDLMGQALNVAREAAHSDRPEEIANILDDATFALRKASSARQNGPRPLRLSPPESTKSSGTSSSSARNGGHNKSVGFQAGDEDRAAVGTGSSYGTEPRPQRRRPTGYYPRGEPAPKRVSDAIPERRSTYAKAFPSHHRRKHGHSGRNRRSSERDADPDDGIPQRKSTYPHVLARPHTGKQATRGPEHAVEDFNESAYFDAEDPRADSPTDPQYGGQPPVHGDYDAGFIDDPEYGSHDREAGHHHFGRHHGPPPIARDWKMSRKRIAATIACLNTIFIGLIAGVYAGEVPRIQYQLADTTHWVIMGNVVLFAGLGLSTWIMWPLPLLHGRKPYVMAGYALMLPLQYPQALTVTQYRPPDPAHQVGLLLPRFFAGFALGLANINTLPTLFDLFGASLMSERPHGEIVVYDDVRRQGGGVGVWLGVWTFCLTSSLSIGFCLGAVITADLDPAWGFYIILIMLAVFMLINVATPETRKAHHRRSLHHIFEDHDPEKTKRIMARGEVKLHISDWGPKWWWQEVWAGVILMKRMAFQPGFFILMWYLAWIIAELNLVVLLLGALLSREYRWQSQYVGVAALAVPLGAILALPLTKASWFSRARKTAPGSDVMTFQPRITWSSHLVRRTVFTVILPFAALGYCLSASGPPLSWAAAVIFAAFLGFLTDMGIAECVGLIMETFDTCDLQPGVNTKHRLQSMSAEAKRRRTNYSSFPRVCAGFFAAQGLAFFLSAAATGISGVLTRTYGAQVAIAVVAAIVLGFTLLLAVAMWRFKQVQVIPNYTAGSAPGERAFSFKPDAPDWKAVVIGNPSGRMRRMNLLELGKWSRWTEIRKLNRLIRHEP